MIDNLLSIKKKSWQMNILCPAALLHSPQACGGPRSANTAGCSCCATRATRNNCDCICSVQERDHVESWTINYGLKAHQRNALVTVQFCAISDFVLNQNKSSRSVYWPGKCSFYRLCWQLQGRHGIWYWCLCKVQQHFQGWRRFCGGWLSFCRRPYEHNCGGM